MDWLNVFSELTPAVASIVAISGISYVVITKLLDMFSKHSDALGVVKDSMVANTSVTNSLKERIERSNNIQEKLVENIAENTRTTEELGSLISKHVNGK